MIIDTEKIKIELARNRISQKELSERCGIAAQNLSIILNRGSCLPATAGKIAHGLNVSIESILQEVRQ